MVFYWILVPIGVLKTMVTIPLTGLTVSVVQWPNQVKATATGPEEHRETFMLSCHCSIIGRTRLNVDMSRKAAL